MKDKGIVKGKEGRRGVRRVALVLDGKRYLWEVSRTLDQEARS